MTNYLQEYTVTLDLILLAHDTEEALEIAKIVQQAVEKLEYKVTADIVDFMREA